MRARSVLFWCYPVPRASAATEAQAVGPRRGSHAQTTLRLERTLIARPNRRGVFSSRGGRSPTVTRYSAIFGRRAASLYRRGRTFSGSRLHLPAERPSLGWFVCPSRFSAVRGRANLRSAISQIHSSFLRSTQRRSLSWASACRARIKTIWFFRGYFVIMDSCA